LRHSRRKRCRQEYASPHCCWPSRGHSRNPDCSRFHQPSRRRHACRLHGTRPASLRRDGPPRKPSLPCRPLRNSRRLNLLRGSRPRRPRSNSQAPSRPVLTGYAPADVIGSRHPARPRTSSPRRTLFQCRRRLRSRDVPSTRRHARSRQNHLRRYPPGSGDGASLRRVHPDFRRTPRRTPAGNSSASHVALHAGGGQVTSPSLTAITRATLAKDLRLEWRSKDAINSMLFFALLVVVIFAFAFDPTAEESRRIAGGLIWTALLFATVVALNQTWARELRNNVLDAYRVSPAPVNAMFITMALANFIFVAVLQFLMAPLFVVFYSLRSVGPV